MSRDQDFLSRWSRRKINDGTDADADGTEPAPDANAGTASPVETGQDGAVGQGVAGVDPKADPADPSLTDDEILSSLGLKHPDTLQAGDNVQGFMQAAVPDRLRRLALRRLWQVNPGLAVVDGLVEYGEDYTDAATVVENMQTLYQVGKGMVRDILEDDDDLTLATADAGVPTETAIAAGHDTSDAAAESADAPTGAHDLNDAKAAGEPPDAVIADGGIAPPEDTRNDAPDSQGKEADQADIEQDFGPTRRRMAFQFAAD